MWSSFRFGFRLLRKNPGYSLTAAITLALGVGASATAYSFVEPLLLRPSAFPEIDRLVSIRRSPTGPNIGGSHKTIPPAQFREWQANTKTFEELAGWTGWMVDVGGPGEAVRVTGCLVTPDFFRTLRVRLAWGAGFTSGAHEPGGPNELVLGHGLWQRTFGGDTNIVGRTVELTQNTYTIVGVTPEPAMYPPGAELWAPLAWNTSDWANHDSNLLHVIGRLHPNESRQRALAELRTFAENQVASRPMERAESTLVARPLREEMMLGDLVMLGFAGGVAGFVLLLVCANVANLQLTHGLARRHELAVRAALGAGRRRLFGQMLAESVMLGLLGGGLGLLLAMWAIPLVKLHLSTELGIAAAQLDAVSLSHRALGFTTVLSVFVGIVTGMFPAWSVSRSDLINTLKEGGRQSAGDHRGQRFRRGLVITQIALAVGLLTGAGVFLHAFQLGLPSSWHGASGARCWINPPRRTSLSELLERLSPPSLLQPAWHVGCPPDRPCGWTPSRPCVPNSWNGE